ncbi:hypothetical protein JET14_11955 [Martelella lutilitoris]|uniref:Uncharacterized protein n=1 Tax=Martelella lutilitoris TaxID=2583532 RepID=A0A7T7HH75_9HYPH|nr:hypothetical protein [Martelella lutilitoris]QQM29053.1 hypothetical protein JET14_11955 [Martelella lutilitoris]
MEDQVVLIVKTPAKIAGKRHRDGDTVTVSRQLAIELLREGIATPPPAVFSRDALDDAAQIRDLKLQVTSLTRQLDAANARIAELEAAAADINSERGETPESEDGATGTVEQPDPETSEAGAKSDASAPPSGEAQPDGTDSGAGEAQSSGSASGEGGDKTASTTTNTSQGATGGKGKTAKTRKTSAPKA